MTLDLSPVRLDVRPIPLTDTSLTDVALRAMRAFFGTQHRPSKAMWVALTAALQTMENMANGVAQSAVYLSSLPAGVGKSTAVQHFCRALLKSPDHKGASVLICVSRLEDIEKFVEAMTAGDDPISKDDFAVFSSEKAKNALGSDDPDRARILFTSHAMVMSQTRKYKFQGVPDFAYHGKARSVRLWDEGATPGEPVVLRLPDLHSLACLSEQYSVKLYDDIRELIRTVEATPSGETMQLPSLDVEHGAVFDIMYSDVKERSANSYNSLDRARITALRFLAGMEITVHKDKGKEGRAILDWRETWPKDIAPMLILDASGECRKAYELWERDRGDLIRLPTAKKFYRDFTAHYWATASGKSAFREEGSVLLEAIAKVINSRFNEEFLVIHHKKVGRKRDFVPMLETLLKPRGQNGTIHYLNYGRHDGTNKFSHVKNVVIAGVLYYRDSDYVARARIAMNKHSKDGKVSPEDFNAVRLGETAHHTMQALTRGNIRNCVDDQASPMEAWIIASVASGIPNGLEDLFPGCTRKRWRGGNKPLIGVALKASSYIIERLKTVNRLKFKEVMTAIDETDHKNFKRLRKHDGFRDVLAAAGIAEDRLSTDTWPTGFRKIEDEEFDCSGLDDAEDGEDRFLSHGFTVIED